MRGVAGMSGWQWLFIVGSTYLPTPSYQLTCPKIEGLVTLIVGAVFGTLFPASPTNPRSLARISLFSEEEKAVLNWRMLTTQGAPDVHGEKKHITLKDIGRTVCDGFGDFSMLVRAKTNSYE